MPPASGASAHDLFLMDGVAQFVNVGYSNPAYGMYSNNTPSSEALALANNDYCSFTVTPASGSLIYDSLSFNLNSTGYSGSSSVLNLPAMINGMPVSAIGDSASATSAILTSVTIPDSVTNIGIGAFLGCSNLTSVTIGNGLTSINSYAFNGCTDLQSWNTSGVTITALDGNGNRTASVAASGGTRFVRLVVNH